MNKVKIQMADLQTQYQRLKSEIDPAIQEVVDSAAFIKGPALHRFERNLESYLGVKNVIGCANGTDALQIAFMALGLQAGDEVIVPAFTYVATAEVIGLLGLTPIMVDVYGDTFNIDIEKAENAITNRTKAIVPVHLFGQGCNMDEIMSFASKHNLKVVEDNAQAIGGSFTNSKGENQKWGSIGHIGCTSFFPSKNLGCYGDGGAISTQDDELAYTIRMIANHGQKQKYVHPILGVNSRLDTIQAAVLDVKLGHLDNFASRRQTVANTYGQAFRAISEIQTPVVSGFSDHVYHQYTLRIKNGKRDELKEFLAARGVPSMIYYPIPLYKQQAYEVYHTQGNLEVTETLCNEVLSLPVHTEMQDSVQQIIINEVLEFFN